MTRIIDITEPADPADVPDHLRKLAQTCDSLGHRIIASSERTDETVALANFCKYAGGELRQLADFFPSNVPGLAWATRNLFELNLTVRYVLEDREQFQNWISQVLTDEKEFIEGVLSASSGEENNGARSALEARLSGLEELASRHNLTPSKRFFIGNIAKEVGLEDDYKAVYKLTSKYVHPTSILINAWQDQTPDDSWLDIFIVKSQISAGDTIYRISKYTNISI